MCKTISVAVLGSTGYVGLELVKLLNNHPKVNINFLGSDKSKNIYFPLDNKKIKDNNLPKLSSNLDFEPSKSDVVFLALPHGISNKYVYKFYDKIKIIDLSADYRLDENDVYSKYILNGSINH